MGRTVPTFVQLIEDATARWRQSFVVRYAAKIKNILTACSAACVRTRKRLPINATTIRWKQSCYPSRSIRKSVSGPSNIPEKTMRLDGWILDIYPCPQGMTLWLLTQSQTRHRLIDAFSPAFYVHGPKPRLCRLEQALAKRAGVTTRLTERIQSVGKQSDDGSRSFRKRPDELSIYLALGAST